MKAENVDEYIAACSPDVQPILQKIRTIVKEVAPGAEERISYQMPAFSLNGRDLVYFGAFKKHIGFYPPVSEKLRDEASVYAGEKGNLKFPLDKPIPYTLIEKIVKARVEENQTAAQARKKKK